MPKKAKSRRFDPRFGVSQIALQEEAKDLAREVDDYLILSVNDLKAKLKELREKWERSDSAAEAIIRELPEMKQLAVQCLMYRDSWYLLQLYLEHLKGAPTETVVPLRKSDMQDEDEEKPLTPKLFSEWLFRA